MQALQQFSSQFAHAMTYLVVQYAVHQNEFIPENELAPISDASSAWQALSAWDLQHVAYAQLDAFVRMAWQMVPGESDEEFEALNSAVHEIFIAVQEFELVVEDDEDDEDEVFEFTSEKDHLMNCLAL